MAEVGARGLAGDLCVDGAIGSRTAALLDDYTDGPGRGAQYLDLDAVVEHLRACTERGVVVSNAPDVLTETTADFGFALLMGGFIMTMRWR